MGEAFNRHYLETIFVRSLRPYRDGLFAVWAKCPVEIVDRLVEEKTWDGHGPG